MIKQTAKAKANSDDQALCTCGHAKERHVAGRHDCMHWHTALSRYCECVAYAPSEKRKGDPRF